MQTKYQVKWRSIIVAIIIIFLWENTVMAKTEEPKFTLITSNNNIEIRNYNEMVVAEVLVTGKRSAAINEGFSILASYIEGNNKLKRKIPMTTPVLQQRANQDANQWYISFIMPYTESLQSLPSPNNPRISLRTIKPRKLATIKFTGLASDSNIQAHIEQIKQFAHEQNLPAAEPILAFYSPPWTLPFFKRNEVMMGW